MSAAASSPAGRAGALPTWPVYLLFAGFPVWWLLGLGTFAPAITALVMLALLACTRGVRVPRMFALWAGFVAWAIVAAVQVGLHARMLGVVTRVSNYVAAGVIFLYVLNIPASRWPTSRALRALVAFVAVIAVGGWLGVLIPHLSFSTPLELVLPGSIRANAYVQSLVHPAMAEIQHPYGSPRTFARPSAPFAYTNSWGCNLALLVPVLAAALTVEHRRRHRWLLWLLVVIAAVPAFATLNRGMFLAILVGLVYASIRLAGRGHGRLFVTVVTVLVAGAALGLASGAFGVLQQRLQYSQTNAGRLGIYQEALQGALQSPLLGHGAPRPSATLGISVGTQGQVWNVMFSYGFPALALFLGWFLAVAWRSRRPATLVGLWLHASLVVAVLTTVYYGYDGPQLAVVMVIAALALRPAASPAASRVAAAASSARRPVLASVA